MSERCPNSGLPVSILHGLGVRAVDVGVDDRLPRVLQVLRQLGVHRGGRRAGSTPGMISGDWSSPDPQRVDDGVHQPQHAARALEALEGRPVLVEAVEQLGVDRVGLLDAVLVAAVAGLAREVVGVRVVHLDEAAGRRADRRERVGVGLRRTAAAGRCGRPRSGDAGRHWSATRRTTFCSRFSASRPCAPPTSSALPATGLGVVAALRRRDRDGEQHARRALDRLGQRLRERELVVERAAGEVVAGDEAARVGDPLVDQDHRRRVRRQQVVQRLARAACGRRPRSRPSRTPPCRRAARRARPRSC